MRAVNRLTYSIVLISLSASPLALADTSVTTPLSQSNEALVLPNSGSSMQQVQSTFGSPAEKIPSIGKPPITIWRYADFNVYFENQRVLHSVRFVPYVRPMQIIIE